LPLTHAPGPSEQQQLANKKPKHNLQRV
jgi:hypothetical protein